VPGWKDRDLPGLPMRDLFFPRSRFPARDRMCLQGLDAREEGRI
jgi:hypothetical protein